MLNTAASCVMRFPRRVGDSCSKLAFDPPLHGAGCIPRRADRVRGFRAQDDGCERGRRELREPERGVCEGAAVAICAVGLEETEVLGGVCGGSRAWEIARSSVGNTRWQLLQPNQMGGAGGGMVVMVL